MSDVVFILGAGASRQADAPLMLDFLDVASDLLRTNRVSKKSEFEKVFAAVGGLQCVHSKAQLDLNNIESIFTVLELSKTIKTMPGLFPENIPETIDALKVLIVQTLEEKMRFPVESGAIRAPHPYGEFAGLLKFLQQDAFPQQSVSVITFNYDVGADLAMHQAGLGPNYGLGGPEEASNQVALHKLHGSLNWGKDGQTGRVIALPLTFVRNLQYFDQQFVSLRIGTDLAVQMKRLRGQDVVSEPVIVPPSWNKSDYHGVLSDVWASAARHLSEAEHIFVIGYSLPETDSFFRHLYALGSVGSRPLRRFEVFNPDESGDVDSRFRGLLGPGAMARYHYHPMKFDQAIRKLREYFPRRA